MALGAAGNETSETGARRALIAGLAFALVTFLLRVPFLRLPFGQQDEGYYAAVARATIAGKQLYAELGFVRPPGMHAAYATAVRLSELLGIPYDLTLRVLAALVAAATVGVLARYLFRRFRVLPAAIGSTLAALLGASLALQNEANSETWMMLPYVASVVVVLGAMERVETPGRRRAAMVAAGALTGAAALFKEVALVNLAVPLLSALVLPGIRRMRRGLEATAFFAVGVLAVQAATIAAMALGGQARDFVYYTWFTRLLYVAEPHTESSALELLLRNVQEIRQVFVAPLVAALVTSVAALVGRSPERTRERGMVLFALGWLAVSFIGVAASGRFYHHYYIQASAPVGLLLAASAAATTRAEVRAAFRWATLGVVVVACLCPAYSWVSDARKAPRVDAARAEWRDLAGRADAATPADGTAFVWGDLASVRAYSDVRHVVDEVWVGYPFGEPGGREALGRRFPSVGDRLLAGLEESPPDTIVLTAQLGPYLPGVRAPRLRPRDDLRVEALLTEMIAEEYRELERGDRYVVFVRDR